VNALLTALRACANEPGVFLCVVGNRVFLASDIRACDDVELAALIRAKVNDFRQENDDNTDSEQASGKG
jgi:hypothetical protein